MKISKLMTVIFASLIFLGSCTNLTLSNSVKDQDQFAISTDELFVDEDLKITLATSTTYIITGAITASSTSKRPDINMTFNSPSGSSMALTFGSFDGSAKVAGSGLFSSDASEVDIDLPLNEVQPGFFNVLNQFEPYSV